MFSSISCMLQVPRQFSIELSAVAAAMVALTIVGYIISNIRPYKH